MDEMDKLIELVSEHPWSLAVIIPILILIGYLVMKFGGKLKFDLFGQTIEIDVPSAQEHMQKLGAQAVPGVSATAIRPVEAERSDLSARDGVLESWGSLKQIVYDLALVQRIQLTPATKTPEAISRLLNAHVVPKELAEAIVLFYNEGKKIADKPDAKVDKSSAVSYQEWVYRLLDWIMCNHFNLPPPEQPAAIPERKTRVGGSFPPPATGGAVMALLGISGVLNGRQFAVDKGVVRIGKDAASEVSIAGDDYVSSHHAEIRYDKGSYWLADVHSKNGTFLNGFRLKESPVALNVGDRIRIGNSTLEVVRVSGR